MNAAPTQTVIAGVIGESRQVGTRSRTVFDYLHEWVVTVDHKKLGLMYIIYGLLFFVVAGVEAILSKRLGRSCRC